MDKQTASSHSDEDNKEKQSGENQDHTELSPLDDDSGLEIEQDDPQINIEHPFDPEKIRVRTTPYLVEQIVSRIDHEEIDLAPDFQRAFVWKDKQKCRLIESLLLRIPIPVFYVAADEKENWSVVDGVQRMSTIYSYVTNEFPLSQLEYLDQFEGRTYSGLPRPMQRRINETQFVVNVIEPGTPEEVMFNIFRRINTGGEPLKGQEIRNALHSGLVREYLRELAETEEFIKATAGSIKKLRMADRECILRFLAFYIDPWNNYDTNDLDGYLSRAMTKINEMSPEQLATVAEDFKRAMRAAFDIFDDDAFRKRYDPDEFRRPVSKALFEAWSVQLAHCSQEELDKLVRKRQTVADRFISLMNDDGDFDRAISYSTGIPGRVKKRFGAIEQLVEEIL